MLGSDRFAFETPNVIDPGDLPPSVPERTNEPPPPHQQPAAQQVSPPPRIGPSVPIVLQTASSKDDDDSYEARHRLLNDIGDLDLTPPRNTGPPPHTSARPYDPYHDDEDDNDDHGEYGDEERGHSLPTVEEARLYATSLLRADRDVLRASSSPQASLSFGKARVPRTVRIGGRSLRSHSGNGGSPGRAVVPSYDEDLDSGLNPPKPRKHAHAVLRRFAHCDRRIVAIAAAVAVAIVLTATLTRRHPSAPSSSSPYTGGNGSGNSTNSASPQDPYVPQNLQVRQQELYEFFSNNGISTQDSLQDASSPQGQALRWVAALDDLQRPVPTQLHSDQRMVQRYVLAVLYYALNGPEWEAHWNWMSGTDECSWFETSVAPTVAQVPTNITTALGVTCNPHTLGVQGLYLPSNGLRGTLPPELQFLTDLELLAVPYNQISGKLSAAPFGTLTKLNYLDLRNNLLEGTIPEWVGDFSRLQVLGLATNQLAGSVPPSLGTLAFLKTLSLSDNSLTGSLRFVEYLHRLEYLWVDRNMFGGAIDDDFLSDNPRLLQADLSFNDFRGNHGLAPGTSSTSSNSSTSTGLFPPHLLQHPTLQVLNVDDNSLDVKLPPLQQPNNVLRYLSLRQSTVHGTLPSSIASLGALEHLDLFANSLTGTVPYEVGNMPNLTYLVLGQNAFGRTQDFPPYVSRLTNLRELSLQATQMGGYLPNWLGTLTELKLLDLSHNYLAGNIPSSVWQLPNLNYLVLHDNSLTGTIPLGLDVADDLRVVSLYQNLGLTGDANIFCTDSPETEPNLVAVDCSVSCGSSCCSGECCSVGGSGTGDGTTTTTNDDDAHSQCFPGKIATYMSWYADRWEFNYTRADYAFDPAILLESGVATSTVAGDGAMVLTKEDGEP